MDRIVIAGTRVTLLGTVESEGEDEATGTTDLVVRPTGRSNRAVNHVHEQRAKIFSTTKTTIPYCLPGQKESSFNECNFQTGGKSRNVESSNSEINSNLQMAHGEGKYLPPISCSQTLKEYNTGTHAGKEESVGSTRSAKKFGSLGCDELSSSMRSDNKISADSKQDLGNKPSRPKVPIRPENVQVTVNKNGATAKHQAELLIGPLGKTRDTSSRPSGLAKLHAKTMSLLRRPSVSHIRRSSLPTEFNEVQKKKVPEGIMTSIPRVGQTQLTSRRTSGSSEESQVEISRVQLRVPEKGMDRSQMTEDEFLAVVRARKEIAKQNIMVLQQKSLMEETIRRASDESSLSSNGLTSLSPNSTSDASLAPEFISVYKTE